MSYKKAILILLLTFIITYSINKTYFSHTEEVYSINLANGDKLKKFDKIYSISIKNKNIGLCTQIKDNYSCKIYLKQGNKKTIHEIKMQRKGDLVIYSSPSLNFKRKISFRDLIYPFLFDNLDYHKKIYYPMIDKLIDKKELKIHKTKNGYYASPFYYNQLNKLPNKLYYFDVLNFREVKSQKIKKEYPSKYVISFDSEFVPPSDLRQNCKKIGKKIKCVISNSSLIKNNLSYKKENIIIKKQSLLNNFIKKYKLNSYDKTDSLIPFLITALHKEIKYQDISKKMSVEEILSLKKGDCTEFSQISVDVFKKLGISAKRIYGLIYKAEKGKWLYHSWVEYYSNNTIKAFDPTNKKAFIDLNYLKLGEENKDGIIIIPLDIDYIKFENVFF